jgi:hypothetical protein
MKIGGEVLVSSSTDGGEVRPSVGALSDGGWIVSWNSVASDGSTKIYQQRFDDHGNKILIHGANDIEVSLSDTQLDNGVADQDTDISEASAHPLIGLEKASDTSNLEDSTAGVHHQHLQNIQNANEPNAQNDEVAFFARNVNVSDSGDDRDEHAQVGGDGSIRAPSEVLISEEESVVSGQLSEGSEYSHLDSVVESDAHTLNGDTNAQVPGGEVSEFTYGADEDLYDLSQLGSASEAADAVKAAATNDTDGLTTDDLLDRDMGGAIDLGQFGDGSGAGDDIGLVTENTPGSVGSGPDTSVSSAFSEPDPIYDMPSTGASTIWIEEPDRVVA